MNEDKKQLREQTIRNAKCNIILDAALDLFAEKGFHETRLEDIAIGAGFSKASLYNYYDNKEVLFLNLIIREYERLVQAVREKVDERAPLEDNLRNILNTIFTFWGRHFAFILTISHFRAMTLVHIESISRHHKNLITAFEKSRTEINSLMTKCLCAARKRDEFQCHLNDRMLAKYIGSMVRGILIDWKIEGRMGDIDSEVEQLLAFLRSGLQTTRSSE
jgi:AcrR family transcriptional regulator